MSVLEVISEFCASRGPRSLSVQSLGCSQRSVAQLQPPLGCVLEAPAGWRLLPAPGTAAGSPSTAFNCSWGLDLPFIHEPGAAAPIQTHGWEPTGRAGVSLALLHCSSIRAGARAAAALADFEAPLNLSLSPPVIPKTPVLQAALCWCCKCCAGTGKQTWK